jgi:hypothetical protein
MSLRSRKPVAPTVSSAASPNAPLAFAAVVRIPWPTRAWNVVRLLYACVVSNNPVLWPLREGGRNPQADLEGPYYVPGAPDRALAPGKAVFASLKELEGVSPAPSCGEPARPY